MIKRILVPLDGSGLAEGALSYAEQIATKTGAKVLLLTSVYQDDSWAGHAAEVNRKWAPIIQTYQESKAQELRAKGVTATEDIVSGPAAEAILARVADESIDLIAISSHGRSGVSRWVLGSVAYKVLQAAACPTLLVRPAALSPEGTKAPSIGKILVPLDGSEHSLAVLPFVEDLAKATDASLVLLHVVSPPATYVGIAAGFITMGDALDQQLDWAKQFLARIVKDVQGRGLMASQIVVVGLGASEIVQVAQREEADLIALSTHGSSGLARWVMGSVADGVVHQTKLPCLVVRPPGAEKPA